MIYLKNGFIFFLVYLSKILRIKCFAEVDSTAPRLLIVTTTGFGDTLWATPALRAIKKAYPKAFVTVLTSPLGQQVLAQNPHIDRLLTLPHGSFFKLPFLWKTLHSLRLETAFIFHLSQRPILPLCYFAKPKNIIGTEGLNKGLDRLLTHKLPRKYQHEILRRLDMLSLLGIPTSDIALEVFPSLQDKRRASHVFASLHLFSDLPIIAFNPGSKDIFKRWSPSAFIELGQKLYETCNAQILILGNQEEKALAEMIANAIPNAKNLAGLFSITELAAFLGYIHILITNDTGTMHLSFATQTKTIALFCPTDPHLCGPLMNSSSHVLQAPLACSPCLHRKCREPFCMLQLSPAALLQKVQHLLTS